MREPRSSTLLLALALVACGEEAAPRPHAHEEAREPATAEPTSVAAPSSGCAADLAARTPDAVRATLGDLGYEALFEDTCIAQRAEVQGDPAGCAALSVSTLRDRCVARVAIASGHPADCPTARTIDGRDPLCVALAARDRRLCAIGPSLDRAICETALGGNACARLRDAAQGACTVRATDLGARIHGDVRTSPALAPAMAMHIGAESRTSSVVDRGARLTAHGCTRVLVLGDQSHLTAPFGLASMAFDAVLRGDPPIEITLSSLPSDTASTLSATVDGLRAMHASSGTLTITRLEPELGGVVEGTIHAAFAGEVPMIDATFTTFVRDVDPPCE